MNILDSIGDLMAAVSIVMLALWVWKLDKKVNELDKYQIETLKLIDKLVSKLAGGK